MSRFEAYLGSVAMYRAQHPDQRDGQAHMNVWLGHYQQHPFPTFGGPKDPFYDDDNLPAFLEFVRGQLTQGGSETGGNR